MTTAEQIAKAFHECYEKLAPAHGYETRTESAKPWDSVPENNRLLMEATVGELLATGWIDAGAAVLPPEPGADQERMSLAEHDSPATRGHLKDVSAGMDRAARRRAGLEDSA